jgi:hypothetical protein
MRRTRTDTPTTTGQRYGNPSVNPGIPAIVAAMVAAHANVRSLPRLDWGLRITHMKSPPSLNRMLGRRPTVAAMTLDEAREETFHMENWLSALNQLRST